jgi:hypothetical protein
MLSKILKKIPIWFSASLAFATLANKDSENFFPLSSHSDLRFQIIGESLEILVLVGLFAVARRLAPRNNEIFSICMARNGSGNIYGSNLCGWIVSHFLERLFSK